MALLDLFVLVAVIVLIYFTVTQIFIPIYRGTRVVPVVHHDDLEDDLEVTRSAVSTLSEQTHNLSELQVLVKQKAELEAQIAALRAPKAADVQPVAEQTQSKE